MDTFKSMLGAWGKGEFATLDNPAWAAHMTKDFKFDATAAAGLHPIFKMYEGYARDDFREGDGCVRQGVQRVGDGAVQ